MIIHMESKSDFYLTLVMQINSRWIKDANVKRKTLKLLEENVDEYLQILRVKKGLLKHWRQKSPL